MPIKGLSHSLNTQLRVRERPLCRGSEGKGPDFWIPADGYGHATGLFDMDRRDFRELLAYYAERDNDDDVNVSSPNHHACNQRRNTAVRHARQDRRHTKSSSDLLADIFLSVTVPVSTTSEHFLRVMSVNSGLYSCTPYLTRCVALYRVSLN